MFLQNVNYRRKSVRYRYCAEGKYKETLTCLLFLGSHFGFGWEIMQKLTLPMGYIFVLGYQSNTLILWRVNS